MAGLRRSLPEGLRLAAIFLAVLLLTLLAGRFGWPIDWGTALLYGVALSLASRWPIILPGTGTRVFITAGLALEAYWHHGPVTAYIIILLEFGIRVVTLYRRRLWAWFHPLHAMASLALGHLVSVLVTGVDVTFGHVRVPSISEASFTFAYVFWFSIILGYALLGPSSQGSWFERVMDSFRQAWWTPLAYLGIAWPLELAHASVYPISVFAVMAVLWVHYEIGTLTTNLFQERAVAQMRRLTPSQTTAQRTRTHQVMRTVHLLGGGVQLSMQEKRMVSYAALLQEWLPEEEPLTPLWLPEPAGAERQMITKRTQAIVEHLARDGALGPVSDLIRMRLSAYDGTGDPSISGTAIPRAAQVLAAANALVDLQERGIARSFAEAAAWIQAHAASRFSPDLMGVMTYTFRPGSIELAEGIPQAVRDLQRLVSTPRSFGLAAWWRALLRQVQGQVGLEPQLPAEVQAVARLATILASDPDTNRTAHTTVEVIGQLTGGKVLLALNEDDENALLIRCRAGYGFTQASPVGALLDLQHPQISRLVLQQTPGQVDDLREIPTPAAREVAVAEGIGSVLFVPLVARGRVIGMLMVGMRGYHWFTPREVGLIHLMAGQVAIALENARLMAEATERLHKVEELRMFSDTLLDNLSAAILVVDTGGKLVSLNASAQQRFGTDRGVVVGQPLPELLMEACQVDKVLAGEEAPEVDFSWENSTLELQTVPLRDNRGRLMGAICLTRDVTQVRAMETEMRRVEKLAAVGELSAGAAHEIRNPLTSIRGFIQLLQVRAAASEEEYFRIIINEIDRIDGIIRDMLLLARPAPVERVKVSLAALLDEVLLLHKSQLERQLVQVTTDIYPTAAVVAVDPNMLRQLLHNLISNAIQAMPFGGLLAIIAQPGRPGEVSLSIGDTGMGISQENLKRLFVPFFTTKPEGTGLGLALCYSIVEAHGGRIDVDSQEGKGTTFTVTLPVRPGSSRN